MPALLTINSCVRWRASGTRGVWFERGCHINGLQWPEAVQTRSNIDCTPCCEPHDSIVVPWCQHCLHVSHLSRFFISCRLHARSFQAAIVGKGLNHPFKGEGGGEGLKVGGLRPTSVRTKGVPFEAPPLARPPTTPLDPPPPDCRKFRSFFSLSRHIFLSFFPLLGVLLVAILVVFF